MSQTSKVLSGFTVKVIELRFFMILVTLILAVDSYLLLVYQQNMLSSFQSLAAPEASLPAVILFFGVYTFLMSLFFPALRRFFIYLIDVSGIYKYFRSESDDRYSSDWKFPSSLLTHSMKTKNDILYKEVIAHRQQQEEIETNLNIAFALIILLCINAFSGDVNQSIFQTVVNLVESKQLSGLPSLLLQCFTIVMFFFLLIMGSKSLQPDREDRMYMPKDRLPSGLLDNKEAE